MLGLESHAFFISSLKINVWCKHNCLKLKFIFIKLCSVRFFSCTCWQLCLQLIYKFTRPTHKVSKSVILRVILKCDMDVVTCLFADWLDTYLLSCLPDWRWNLSMQHIVMLSYDQIYIFTLNLTLTTNTGRNQICIATEIAMINDIIITLWQSWWGGFWLMLCNFETCFQLNKSRRIQ